MMYVIPEDIEFIVPVDLREALELINKLNNVKALAGGTDLVVDLKTGRFKPKYVVYIGGLKELRYIRDNNGSLHIGAVTTIQEILDSKIIAEKAPLLRAATEKFAYWQIRNTATIGGNLCNASPAADTAPPLLVYEAIIKAESVRGSRLIPIREFFKGPRQTALERDELVTEIIVPYKDLENSGYSYFKVGRRRGYDISLVAVACVVKVEGGVISDVRLALNSVAPIPVRAMNVEKTLIGKKPSLEIIEESSKLVVYDISPISDVRAPIEYRQYMAKLLTREALLEALKKTGVM
ncbi:MAG: xanthine dehydrogenase family protein subunit M [Desulfurococcaceae archaeon]|jgi:carbon-monoxide dehydrogenase medium subunit|nr:xanthine dehydrogenase family protein subunit M [Desulfurococcaceae archaeon]